VTTSPKSVCVVGAGIIGTVSAFRLAREGYSVVVVDPSPGRGATYAAAGMVAPLGEITPGELANYHLQLQAIDAWRELSAMVAEVTGETIELHETGTLVVGWDASDRRQVTQFAQVAASFGASVLPVNRVTTEELFDALSDRISEGLLLEGDAWLNPDQAMSLLTLANRRLGVRYVPERCIGIDESTSGVRITTTSEVVTADHCIAATGSEPPFSSLAFNTNESLRPVRGFTLRVQGFDRSALPTVRAFVHGRNFYLVSRPGGYCVLGASTEEKSVPAIEAGELSRLLRDGLDVFPELETCVFEEARSGLRPASTSGEPFFATSALGRSAWVSGHYRHGVTLSPLVGEQVVAFIEG